MYTRIPMTISMIAAASLLAAPRAHGAESTDGLRFPNTYAGVALAAQEEAAATDAEPEWLSNIDVSISGATGNTETMSFRFGFNTVRETERQRTAIDASYSYGESDSVKDRSDATAGVLQDWYLLDSPWGLFATVRYDFDEFKQWRHRASAHGGGTYRFIKREDLMLIGRVGAGVIRQWNENDTQGEGLLGLEVNWTIDDRQQLNAATTYYPSFDGFDDYRLVSRAEWRMALDVKRGLNLVAGIESEYESEVPDEFKNHDLRFYAGLGFAF